MPTVNDARKRRVESYARSVDKMFAQTVNDIVALHKIMPELAEGEMYSFDNLSPAKRAEVIRLFRRLHASTTTAIKSGVATEWELSNQINDKLVRSVVPKRAMAIVERGGLMNHNATAMNAFINRVYDGMNLSDRVWKTTQQLKSEMEVALTVSIGSGQAANSMQLAKEVRQCLVNPDAMFKRFRYKDDKGEWKKKWKKRVKDEETGRYKFVDVTPDDPEFHPGRGVYRSAVRNAMRLTRTETNMAYHEADHARWKKLDFVRGITVKTSHSHPERDICDDFAGDYPKEFKFIGWHPHCFCQATPKLASEDDMETWIDNMLDSGVSDGYQFETPEAKPTTNMRKWVKANEDKLKYGDRLPYFMGGNRQMVDAVLKPKLTPIEIAKQRHDARTTEDIKAIQEKWARRVANTAKKYGVDVTSLNTAVEIGEVDAIRKEITAIQNVVAHRQTHACTTQSRDTTRKPNRG